MYIYTYIHGSGARGSYAPLEVGGVGARVVHLAQLLARLDLAGGLEHQLDVHGRGARPVVDDDVGELVALAVACIGGFG